jgi:two-component system cell cycle sensor histidine kinase/response regulator CckA
VVRGMQSMLRRLIGEHVHLAFRCDDALGYVKADPSQIEQVILNLAVNAQDAMPDGGTLTIETGRAYLDTSDAANHMAPRAGYYAMLAVSDTGIGMDESTRQRIFEPFFTTKEIGKGTGLGLSTVYGIVQQSEGGLFVYSEPGHGTTFKVYLPQVDDVPDMPLILDSVDQSGSETVLLVEDEPALRALTKRVLSSAGYTVLDAGSNFISKPYAPAELRRKVREVLGP